MLLLSLGALLLACGAGLLLAPRLLRLLVRRRLKGYVRDETTPDPRLPERAPAPKRVAVLGAGVAGLTAALTLARRGYAVTLFEKKAHAGGKLGSWKVDLGGEEAWVSHGFHAFFPHYHNLNRLLDALGLRRGFERIDDYVILGRGGDLVRFGGLDPTPGLNLLALARAGVFGVREALAAPGRDLYGVFLEYEQAATFARYDHLSFRAFSDLARVPPRLKLAFDTFARAFFADEGRLSFAELVKSFHFYYLGHDGGLVYTYPRGDYERTLLAPLRAELARHGAELRLGAPVSSLAVSPEGLEVQGERFDKVILAADVVGARAIMTSAQGLPAPLVARFAKLAAGQRYAVLRLWLDRDVRSDIPVFVITERVQALDALAVYHRLEDESAAWVAAHGGAVLELHSYAVPDAMPDDAVRDALLADMRHYFPDLAGASVRHEVLQINADFTAFHVGMFADRPETHTGVPGLFCAGDWVKLPFPAMLLEAACASGLVAANGVLAEDGLRQELVRSVPLRGMMAGMPEPPARAKLIPPRGSGS